MKKTGTNDEVWAGTAAQTPGKLRRADLMLNSKGKVVSIRQHLTGKKAVGVLAVTNRKTPGAMHPDHAKGHAAARSVRAQHGKVLLGGVLGGLLSPILGGISPALGHLAPAIGGTLPL